MEKIMNAFKGFVRSVAAVALLLTGSVFAADDPAEKFKEGDYYQTLKSNELSSTQQITEFFSFYCGHCFMFRSTLEELKAAYPNVEFRLVPVGFLGGENGLLSQKAYAAAEALGIAEPFQNELFNQIHKMGKVELSPQSLADIAAYVGGDKDKFTEIMSGFMSMSQAAAYNAEADKDQIHGVPSIKINNKYIIIKAEKDEMKNLITYLLEKDGVPVKNAAKADSAK